MSVLSLKIRICDRSVTKTMQFEPQTLVYDACKIIREKMPEANMGDPKEYGLFLSDEEANKGVWMDSNRNLEYYLVRSGDIVEYKKKFRILRVAMLDGAVKTLMVDDSQPVAQLMITICTRIGIANYEEYSLVREEGPAHDAVDGGTPQTHRRQIIGDSGTLTLGRSREKKMDALRKQLHTEEEVNWVDHAKTLREQGITEEETLLLRRKFFYSDQNIDARDPVQLNLLYVQCRDAIINGTHPVTADEAFEFAGLQCQAEFGSNINSKQAQAIIDVGIFLPAEYQKLKAAEKRILQDHSKYADLSEVQAKVKYTERCRSLRTYGVTFFLVKEKMKGKNKLTRRLMGVNKDCIMRVDDKTKEVIKEWPLEQVMRWAASPNTFTLDFGDYQDSYYTVQTRDGEKIAQLIAGYIDILLKKKKARDHFGIVGDEGSTMLEDTVAPAKATIMSHHQLRTGFAEESNVALPGVLRMSDGQTQYDVGAIEGKLHATEVTMEGQQPRIFDTLGKSQRAFIGAIVSAEEKIEHIYGELAEPIQLPPIASDPAWRANEVEVQREDVELKLAAMGAATAQVVQLSATLDREDQTRISAAVDTISTNLPDVSRGVRTIAALSDDPEKGTDLITATRRLCTAFTDLLTAVHPEKQSTHEALLTAASRVGDYSHAIIERIEEPSDYAKEFQDILVGLAKSVANSTAQLVLRAKAVSAYCPEQPTQDRIINSATQCAFATSQLVACARVVAPTIESPACQTQLTEAAKQVAHAVESLLKNADGSYQPAEGDDSLSNLKDAARHVTKTLSDMLIHIRGGPGQARVTHQERELEVIITSTDKLISYTGSSNEMIRQAKILAEATTHLVTHIRGDAEIQKDKDNRQRLMDAARSLADATTKMIEAAKLCGRNPHEPQHQLALKNAAADVRTATSFAASDQFQEQALRRLELASKHVAATTTQTISVAHASKESLDPATANQLSRASQSAAERIPHLIAAIRATQNATDRSDSSVGNHLLQVALETFEPCSQLYDQSQTAMAAMTDDAHRQDMRAASTQLSQSLAELTSACSTAQQVFQTQDIESAQKLLELLSEDVRSYQKMLDDGALHAIPGESRESGSKALIQSTRSAGSSIAQFVVAIDQQNSEVAIRAAHTAAEHLRTLTDASRCLAALEEPNWSSELLSRTEVALENTNHLLNEAKPCLTCSNHAEHEGNLTAVANQAAKAIHDCALCLPGQQSIDVAIASVASTSAADILEQKMSMQSRRNRTEIHREYIGCAGQLNDAATNLVSSFGAPLMDESVDHYINVHSVFIQLSTEIASFITDPAARSQFVSELHGLVGESTKLLQSMKFATSDPSQRSSAATASRRLAVHVDKLVEIVSSCDSAWEVACDNVIRNIHSAKLLLDLPSEPLNELSYYECVEEVSHKSKDLGASLAGIAQKIKAGATDAEPVKEFGAAICRISESAAQASYLIGASDPTSTPGRRGAVRQSQLVQAVDSVKHDCAILNKAGNTKAETVTATSSMANRTAFIVTLFRDAAKRFSDPSTQRRQLISCAKETTTATTRVIETIKHMDEEATEHNKDSVRASTHRLIDVLNSSLAIVDAPEFSGYPAQISGPARQRQLLVSEPAAATLDASCDILRLTRDLATHTEDRELWQNLSSLSHTISDSMKALISAIKTEAPGQLECEAGLEKLRLASQALDKAQLAVSSQSLPPVGNENDLQGYHEAMYNAVRQLRDRLPRLADASKSEAECLGSEVTSFVLFAVSLSQASIASASHGAATSQLQFTLLEQCRTVIECIVQVVQCAKAIGGNPYLRQLHSAFDEVASGLIDSLDEFMKTVDAAASQRGILSTSVENLKRSIVKIDEPDSQSQKSFVDCQTAMVRACREMAAATQEIGAKCYVPNEDMELASLVQRVEKHFEVVVEMTRIMAAVSPGNSSVIPRIRSAVHDLGHSCVELSECTASIRGNSDRLELEQLSGCAVATSEKIAHVMAVLQMSSSGTQACINAASTVSGIIGDLDTTIMFATAGTLNPERDGDVFSDHRDAMFKTAKALVEDTKALVAGAASSQEQLAVAAQNAVRTIVQLSDVVKCSAASLTSNNADAQVLVINAVKDVAAALASLIQATKNASGKVNSDPAMDNLRYAARAMVGNVTTLINTVKTVEDNQQVGTRALETAIEAITQQIRIFDASDCQSPTEPASPEALIRATKPITTVTGRAVSASQSCQQHAVMSAANLARQVVTDLLMTCKAAASNAEDVETRNATFDAGKSVASKMRELLQALHAVIQKPCQETRQLMIPVSRSIAQSVADIVGLCEDLKGSEWIDPTDPTFIAENELMSAANSIEAAARKLELLKPREQSSKPTDESLSFDEQILCAAKSITTAVAALVKSASVAQRELVDQGRLDANPKYQSDDYQWSEGLISASRRVAAATHSLCGTANALVQGAHATEVRLISAAKQVAASTAQLLVACRVKADANSTSMLRLQKAGNAVKSATEALCDAARQSIDGDDERSIAVSERLVGGMTQMLDAQSEVILKERELDEARAKLTTIRKATYTQYPAGGSTETDE